MTDVDTRDLNKNAARAEPIAPSLPAMPSRPGTIVTPSAPAAPSDAKKLRPSVFAADIPLGSDALGQAAALRPLAELATHRDAETPLAIGLLGGPGSGKSFALATLLADVEALSAASNDTMVRRVNIVKIDAATLDGEPSVALAAAVYDKLGTAYPEFVREAAHAARDPHVVAREAAQRLDDARRRLDSERQSLHEIENRRGRLTETVLFESAGSQVDTYARANRGRIESRLASFGITGDPIANYKSMVRDLADAGGPMGRAGAALRAFWAFAGQGKLLITAIVLLLVGVGLDDAVAQHDVWLNSLATGSKGFVPLGALARRAYGLAELRCKTCLYGRGDRPGGQHRSRRDVSQSFVPRRRPARKRCCDPASSARSAFCASDAPRGWTGSRCRSRRARCGRSRSACRKRRARCATERAVAVCRSGREAAG
ncbi:MAG: hypothetical protein WDN29_01210 [Methylovirgula sp.]